MNVICYCRVSTDEQRDKGYSLQNQEEILLRYCKDHHYNIVGIFTEDFSAKNFNRPEWKKIMSFIKKNKGVVDLILCHKWDRFSRNIYDAYTTINELQKNKVTVNTVENPLDIRKSDNKILLSLYLVQPEVENDRNSFNTTNASRKARRLGVWTGTAPKGYVNFRDENERSTLRPNNDAPFITEAFLRMSSGGYSADQIRKWLNKNGMRLGKQAFLNIIRNPVYTGKILVKSWLEEPEEIVDGLHPALITEDVFHKANDVLAGRKRKMKFHEDKSDLYPLKGFLKCPVHGTALSAYGAKGRKGEIYHYYLCPKEKCSQRYRIEDVHKSIEEVLSKISAQAQTLTLYRRILEKTFEKEDILRKDEIHKMTKEVEKLQARRSNLQYMVMDNKISPEDFHEMKQTLDKELVRMNSRLDDLKQQMTPFRTYINKTVPMLENIADYYRNASGVAKKKILACIFDEKIVLENGKVASTPFSVPVQVLINANKVFGRSEKKKEVENDLLFALAPPAGLEPATL